MAPPEKLQNQILKCKFKRVVDRHWTKSELLGQDWELSFCICRASYIMHRSSIFQVTSVGCLPTCTVVQVVLANFVLISLFAAMSYAKPSYSD